MGSRSVSFFPNDKFWQLISGVKSGPTFNYGQILVHNYATVPFRARSIGHFRKPKCHALLTQLAGFFRFARATKRIKPTWVLMLRDLDLVNVVLLGRFDSFCRDSILHCPLMCSGFFLALCWHRHNTCFVTAATQNERSDLVPEARVISFTTPRQINTTQQTQHSQHKKFSPWQDN